MMRLPRICSAGLSVLALHLGLETALASDGIVAGRLTDTKGAAVADATIMLFPADEAVDSSPCEDGRTDAHGAFSAVLPPGRFVVAAVKRGYEISMTRIDTRARRIVSMKMQPREWRGASADPRDAGLLEADRFLRQQRADVLREEEASVPVMVYLAESPSGTGVGSAGEDRSRALLGPVDGDLAHSFGAESLFGLVDGAGDGDEGARTTALTLQAPLSQGLTWSLEGMSARTRIGLPDGAGRLTGGSDRLAIGVDYVSAQGRTKLGTLRGWFGAADAGAGRITQRVLEGAGEMALNGNSGRRLALGVRAWGGAADLGDGDFLTLDRAAAMEPEPASVDGAGFSIYTGERLQIGSSTLLDYGLEYRADSLSGESRPVPRLGVSHTVAVQGSADVTVRSELLIDPERPGGVLAIHAAPFEQLQVSASLSVLPANAVVDADPARPGRPAAWGLPSPGQRSADTREIDLALSGNFGAFSGSLTGAIGRAGPRSLPVILEGPLPLVSYGSERFYETRVGVAYSPWEARMEVGYRRVESEARREDRATQGPPLDYRLLDLMLSKVLPSPRSMLGARLRALVEWQGLNYDSLFASNGGSSLSGITSRLSGGVGLTF